ncbi:redox-regulated ATPase YchF [Patescibacteria group bacterium]|nr:redox-regulated ATPase YchF [Patescibacteria group bacterium]
MSLSVGIVGLPNVGKSTLFNALVSSRQAPVGIHPFTTVKPNTGVVRLADTRLERLSKLIKPAKTTPATVTFIDIAGLVKGAHKGEGLGNEFLAHIRDVDAICHVVREFDDTSVAHVMGSVSPLRDRDVVRTELTLKDLETLERAREGKKSEPVLQASVEKLVAALNEDTPLSSVDLNKEEREAVHHLHLLTAKPVFYVLNVSEEDLEELKGEVKQLAGKLENSVVVCAKLEEELIDFPEDERAVYRHEMGLRGSGLDRMIAKAYALLRLLTFYTVKGAEAGGEVRAWPVPAGSTALNASGRVHSDFSRRFITAEVIGVEQLLKYEGWKQAKEKGRVRTEGRDYMVQDGDVIEFRVSG